MSPLFRAAALSTTLLAAFTPNVALHAQIRRTLAGDWDAYVALGSTSRGGFEGWRRMGYAHFAPNDSANVGVVRRRTGEPMLTVQSTSVHGDTVLLNGERGQALDARWHHDTLVGVMLVQGRPSGTRMRLVRRATAAEPGEPYRFDRSW